MIAEGKTGLQLSKQIKYIDVHSTINGWVKK